ncbi:(11Z)-hexadec-11-enoyl-CoA conjugase-like [Pectinophora gossypiella]|uniref:(11Z)-hexadec-11-enoyl-CoA conjugase-like n=1 Tax=Pectinophora gossypiella TaxID=13191 RepID=UPI00214F2CFC|nr:(11Z)-hexadec-11-enoyl-CoA conjugase-like [Pectinophora gossypiella]
MAPNLKKGPTIYENGQTEEKLEKLVPPQANPWKYQFIYPAVLYLITAHVLGVYALYCLYYNWRSVRLATVHYNLAVYVFAMQGVTAGAHRLWSHRSYKATTPLKVLLVLGQSMSMQYSVLWWAITHRLHHKFSDTDADPHNSARGFFFCHIGWLMVKPHPEALKRRKFVDMSDLKRDPLLVFQRKHMLIITIIMAYVVPILTPVIFWSENFFLSWHINKLRIIMVMNATFSINSFAHRWGTKPFDESIEATSSGLVSNLTLGEGWHNFHHVFPWDYSHDELGSHLDLTTKLIKMFAKIGWAYDLKTVSRNVINIRASRCGDGTIIKKAE